MEKTIGEYLADIQRDTKDIRQKQNIIFVEVLKRGSENAVSLMRSQLAFSIGVASIGVALLAIGLTSRDIAFQYMGIAALVFSMVSGIMLHPKMRDLEKSVKKTNELIDILVKETEESFKD